MQVPNILKQSSTNTRNNGSLKLLAALLGAQLLKYLSKTDCVMRLFNHFKQYCEATSELYCLGVQEKAFTTAMHQTPGTAD